jgi:hypothetical protein
LAPDLLEAPMIWMQTASGIAFDLLNPTPAMVDLRHDVPDALARISRFTGHVPGGIYSVAQHCVIGADALMHETGRPDIAAAFLLYDAKEAFIGDWGTPIKQALAAAAGLAVPDGHNAVLEGMRWLENGIDAAIHAAARVAWPLPPAIAAAVKTMDLRMLATERRQLLAPAPQPWVAAVEAAEPLRLAAGSLTVWPWTKAADEWHDRLNRYCPAALAA